MATFTVEIERDQERCVVTTVNFALRKGILVASVYGATDAELSNLGANAETELMQLPQVNSIWIRSSDVQQDVAILRRITDTQDEAWSWELMHSRQVGRTAALRDAIDQAFTGLRIERDKELFANV